MDPGSLPGMTEKQQLKETNTMATTITPESFVDYELLDTGNGKKLERFGNNIIVRPHPDALWQPVGSKALWDSATASCTIIDKEVIKKAALTKDGKPGKLIKKTERIFDWQKTKDFKEPWVVTFDDPVKAGLIPKPLIFELNFTISQNIGVFPEQASHWMWMIRRIKKSSKPVSVLNLFGYTGAATLAAAAAGATVCHVDASKTAITWARENQKLSGLEQAPIRWIVDDCLTFITREIARGKKYDAIIMDPPPFGKNPKGGTFKFEKEIDLLLAACKQVLVKKPVFFILNSYAMNYTAEKLGSFVKPWFDKDKVESGNLGVIEKSSDKIEPFGIYSRVWYVV